jgi:hypothetical protein
LIAVNTSVEAQNNSSKHKKKKQNNKIFQTELNKKNPTNIAFGLPITQRLTM